MGHGSKRVVTSSLRTGLCETQADIIIFEAEISRAAFEAEIQEQSEPRVFCQAQIFERQIFQEQAAGFWP